MFENMDNGDTSEEDEDFMELEVLFAFPRRMKIYHHRRDYMNELPDADFFQRFRFSKQTVEYIIERLQNDISSSTNRNHALTPEQKVLLALRYYACGSMLVVCGDFISIHKSTASQAIQLVTEKIAALRPEFVNFPTSAAKKVKIAQGFYNIAKFPRCFGAIDCTHICIRSPGANAEVYRNRKHFFSLNVQTVVDADMRIQSVVARWPGSVHDSNIFRNSKLSRRIQNGEFDPYVLVGDAGYAVSNTLLTPLQDPANLAEELYNESQVATRNPVERSYGIWKRRFPILAVGINIRITTAIHVVIATAVLHNIALYFGESVPRVIYKQERAIDMTLFDAIPLPPENADNNEIQQWRLTAPQNQRNRLIQYFGSLLNN